MEVEVPDRVEAVELHFAVVVAAADQSWFEFPWVIELLEYLNSLFAEDSALTVGSGSFVAMAFEGLDSLASNLDLSF
jgi:hypothetical protein